MKLEVYDSENYESWEDAEKNGAIYGGKLNGDEISTDDVKAIINITEMCIRFSGNIQWRLVEE